LGVLGGASLVAAACGGEDFSAVERTPETAAAGGDDAAGSGGSSAEAGASAGGKAGSSGSSNAGSAGSAAGTTGSGGGSTVLCQNPGDCSDNNLCSLDVCNANGVCEHPPKCDGATPRCCANGECGQCCEHTDCPAINDCMLAQCTGGFCINTPGSCPSEDDYCGPSGCMPKEPCDGDGDCTDQDPCTADTCVDGLCEHPSCPDEAEPFCCAGGCGACCGDSQCVGTNPCEVNRCEDGACVIDELCPDSPFCCKSADNTSASCGECCSASDCDDDNVTCTFKVCRAGVCGQEPDRSLCAPDETCDLEEGCLSGPCNDPAECDAPGLCEQVECHDGECRYSDLSCSDSTVCCEEGPLKGTCQSCCSNLDCIEGGDTTAINCCQDDGQCHECCSDLDCQGIVANIASGGGIGIPQPCVTSVCDPSSRKCTTASLPCPNGAACCPDGYCSGGGRECIGVPF